LQRTVYSCKEFEPVELPLDQLVVDGELQVYDSVQGKGYFDIDYRGGRMVLAPKSYVGLIPINDRVALHVIPRFPIANLLYILQKADAVARYVSGHSRSYGIASAHGADPIGIFASRFLESLTTIRTRGLLRRYESRERDDDFRGEIMMSQTVSRHLSQGRRYRQVRRVHELTFDLPENRLLKSALFKIASYCSQSGDIKYRKLRESADRLYPLMDNVSHDVPGPATLTYLLPRFIRRLPFEHREYGFALWLAYLIETRQGVALDKAGPISFDTFVVNLADVFESYLRAVISERITALMPGVFTRNGNITRPKLFVQGEVYEVRPDIYLQRNGKNLAVIDAKYKEKLRADDRQEVITFCEALQSKIAILVVPSADGKNDVRMLGVTRSNIALFVATIDIGAADMELVEKEFVGKVAAVVAQRVEG
jgi:5-methylcytosine-specific restriction enzyme subunit McrC